MSMTESDASAQVAMQDTPVEDALAQAIDSSLKLAVKYHMRGELEHAETLYRGILEALPEHAAANFFLGRLAVGVGQAQAGLPHFMAALEAQPNNLDYRLCYVDALIQVDALVTAREQLALANSQSRGLNESTLHALSERLELRVRIARTIRDTQLSAPVVVVQRGSGASASTSRGGKQPSVKDLGKLADLFGLGRYDDALALARSLTLRFPKHGFAWKVLGAVLHAQGRSEEAVRPMQQAADLMPQDVEARANIARNFVRLGRKQEAEVEFRRALELDPRDAGVHFALAALLQAQTRLAEAELHCLRGLELDPNHIHGHWTLGRILQDTRRPAEAEESYRNALGIDATRACGHNFLGLLMLALHRSTEAEAAFRTAISIEPVSGVSYTNLGLALSLQGRQLEAVENFRRAVEHQPDDPEVYTTLLFNLSLSQTMAPEALFAEHRRFGEIFEAPLLSTRRPHDNVRDPERALQIGFVSGDFCDHAVASFFEPVLQYLAGAKSLVLHAYSTRTSDTDDAVTHRLRQRMSHWHPIADMTHSELAEKIREDGIDILIDLSGHTIANRLPTFARKPAPVQVSWMGYPGTTGLQAMDYYLCDRFMLPPGQFDSQFTEKLVRLPANAPFLPFGDAPAVSDLPALQRGHITFGSFNRLDKINRTVIALWSRILRAVPDARLVLGAMPKGGDRQCEVLLAWFAEEGIDRGRLDFHPRTNLDRYLALYQQVDLCLDTFPYNGGTTSLHALWMGVPTLTLAGSTMPGRVGAALFGHVGLETFVAQDAEAFVAQGISLAQHLLPLAQWRSESRSRFAQSAIGRPALIAAGLESALRTMWKRWCADLPVESFDAAVEIGDPA